LVLSPAGQEKTLTVETGVISSYVLAAY